MLKSNTSVSPTLISTISMGVSYFTRLDSAERTSVCTNSLGVCISSWYIRFILIFIHVISCGFLSKNGVNGYSSFIPPSTYVSPLYFPHANMKGTAILIHTASITFISGCVSFEKYTVSDVFIQNAEMYILVSSSLNVGSFPQISTNFLRIGPISTNPNLLKKEPIRILTKVGIFNESEVSRISSTDIPIPKKSAKIAPAEEPDISLTSASSVSRAFRAPMSEYIPIEAGPNTRYFIFLLNRIEEIDDAKARRRPRIQSCEREPRSGWSDPSEEPHRNREEG